MNVVFLISTVFLFILSIPLVMGKLSNLIAGYNTMNAKEKAIYNELKLCRIVGLTLILASIILFFGAYHVISFDTTIILGITEIGLGIIISNIYAKK